MDYLWTFEVVFATLLSLTACLATACHSRVRYRRRVGDLDREVARLTALNDAARRSHEEQIVEVENACWMLRVEAHSAKTHLSQREMEIKTLQGELAASGASIAVLKERCEQLESARQLQAASHDLRLQESALASRGAWTVMAERLGALSDDFRALCSAGESWEGSDSGEHSSPHEIPQRGAGVWRLGEPDNLFKWAGEVSAVFGTGLPSRDQSPPDGAAGRFGRPVPPDREAKSVDALRGMGDGFQPASRRDAFQLE